MTPNNNNTTMKISCSDPKVLRENADNPFLISNELYPGENNNHKFKPGDLCTLKELESFPEFNGTTVEITQIRIDGEYGKAYYIKGPINKFCNWIYEYRLDLTNPA